MTTKCLLDDPVATVAELMQRTLMDVVWHDPDDMVVGLYTFINT